MHMIHGLILAGGIVLSGQVQPQVRLEKAPQQNLDKAPRPVLIRPAMKTITLSSVPDWAFTIHTTPGMSVKRAHPAPKGGISTAGATIYVQKTYFAGQSANGLNRCGSGSDVLDLREPRKHGFRLVKAAVDQLTPPNGYQWEGFPRRAPRDLGALESFSFAGMEYAGRVAGTGVIACFVGYRANISLHGPADIDPFTGRKITRQPVN